jgi:PKD domain
MRKSPAKHLLTACLLTAGAVVSPLGGGVALAHPKADFDWTPKPVVAGTPVTFVSTSTPFDNTPNSAITQARWDLDGKGTCTLTLTPAATCTATAPAPGDWDVKLTVTDFHGDSDSITKTVAVQPPPIPPNQVPAAAFVALPSSPLVGEEVTFVSYSEDRDGNIGKWAWDMDGDGRFDDGATPVVTRRFAQPGEKTITLRVTDDRGASSTASLSLVVREQPPATPTTATPPPSPKATAPLPRLLSPFPIVRLTGSVTQLGTRVHLLTVRAPRGTRVLVRCRGRGCPIRRARRVVRRAPQRIKAAERRMPAGAVLEVLVSGGDRIGKFTRFKFRQNRLPTRADGCLWPSTAQMAPCPGG